MPNNWPVLKIKYEPTVQAFLSRFSSNLAASIPKLLESIGKRITYRFKANIRDGQTAKGVRFPPLKAKRSKGRNQAMRPLYDSGLLFDSITYRIDLPNKVEVGDPTEYGIFQNRGTKSIPPRAFITFLDDDITSNLYDFAAHQFYQSSYYMGNGPSDL